MATATMTVPIERTSEGVLWVEGTRVPIDTIIIAFHQGATAEGIALRYPTLKLADIYAVLSYYLQHQAEVDAYLQQRQEHAARVRQENETRFPPDGIRARLLARRAEGTS